MKSILQLLVIVNWACSVVYLYAGESIEGFGPQTDLRSLALASLLVSTGAMMDRRFTRFILGSWKMFRLRQPVTEYE